MKETYESFREILSDAKALFAQKQKDYGTSWLILRSTSLTDQIYIKAKRIRSIEEKGVNKVGEDVASEYYGIINYCIMALIKLSSKDNFETTPDDLLRRFSDQVDQILNLLSRKNHDYDEVWREMRISSMTDLIIMKLLRIKQIEDNAGKTLVSEGLDANYMDIVNYSVFCLIRLSEKK